MSKKLTLFLSLLLWISLAQAKDKPKKNGRKKANSSEEVTTSKTTTTKLSARDIEENTLFFDAQRFKALGDNKNAVLAFEKALSFNPNNDAAMFELARLYYITQEDDKSLSNISKAVKLSPDNLWYNLVYAQVLAVKGNYKMACTVYDKVIALEPREVAYYFDKASLLENLGDVNKTIAYYDEIEQIFGVEEYGIDQKKRLYISINKVDKAAAEVEKLIANDSNNIDYYSTLAQLYMSNKQNEKAIAIYNYVLTKAPTDPTALMAMAEYSEQNGDKKQSFEYYLQAFKNSSLGIDVKIKKLYNYIQFYATKRSNYNDAYTLADAVRIAHPKDAKAYAITADLYYVDGKDSLALNYYIKSLEFQKDIFTVWQKILVLGSALDKNNIVKQYSEEAIDLYPTQAIPYYYNGIAMYQLKRYADATRVLQEAYKLSKDNSTLRSQILASLGDNYHEMGNVINSDSCYEQALKLDPQNAYALNNYAYYLSLRKDQLQKAKEYGGMAIKINKSNPNYLDTYAFILFQLGDYLLAEIYQLDALKYSDLSDPVLFEHYGDILFKNNKIEDALNAWQKAKLKGANSEILDKKIRDKKWYEDEHP